MRILLGVDGSDSSYEAARALQYLARPERLIILHVVDVQPADLQARRIQLKSDFELLMSIAHGVAFSPMHGWRGRLTDEEMRDVISYIRMLSPFGPIS